MKVVEFLGAAPVQRLLNQLVNRVRLSLSLLLVISAFCSLLATVATFHSLFFVYFLSIRLPAKGHLPCSRRVGKYSLRNAEMKRGEASFLPSPFGFP